MSNQSAYADSCPFVQHVPPVRVLVRHGDAEVVGHDVDHDLQSRVRGRRQQRGPALLAAPVGVDPEGIGGVVPVVGAGGRLQDGRQVDRTHPEIAQIADQRGGVVQGEAPADLEPVRGGGRRHHRRLTVGLRRAGRWGVRQICGEVQLHVPGPPRIGTAAEPAEGGHPAEVGIERLGDPDLVAVGGQRLRPPPRRSRVPAGRPPVRRSGGEHRSRPGAGCARASGACTAPAPSGSGCRPPPRPPPPGDRSGRWPASATSSIPSASRGRRRRGRARPRRASSSGGPRSRAPRPRSRGRGSWSPRTRCPRRRQPPGWSSRTAGPAPAAPAPGLARRPGEVSGSPVIPAAAACMVPSTSSRSLPRASTPKPCDADPTRLALDHPVRLQVGRLHAPTCRRGPPAPPARTRRE